MYLTQEEIEKEAQVLCEISLQLMPTLITTLYLSQLIVGVHIVVQSIMYH